MHESAPQRGTEGGTGFSVGAGGHKMKLRERSESRRCLGQGVVAMRHRSKEWSSVQRKCELVLNSAAVRDHTSGIKAEPALMEGEPEQHAHQRVVQAHSGRYVGMEEG
jgi:hypothetical protein